MKRRPAALQIAGDDTLRLIAEVAAKAAGGDFEARLPAIGESEQARAARAAVNSLLDITDAFVRESGAALGAAAEVVSTGVS